MGLRGEREGYGRKGVQHGEGEEGGEGWDGGEGPKG